MPHGHSALSDSIEMTQAAVQIGGAGVLMLPPFTQGGLRRGCTANFAEVIERVGEERLRLYFITSAGLQVEFPESH